MNTERHRLRCSLLSETDMEMSGSIKRFKMSMSSCKQVASICCVVAEFGLAVESQI